MKLFFKYLIRTPWKIKKSHFDEYKDLGIKIKQVYSEMRNMRGRISRMVDGKYVEGPRFACFEIIKNNSSGDHKFFEGKCMWIGDNDVCTNVDGGCPHHVNNRLYCECRQQYEKLLALRKQFWKMKFEQVQNKK